MKEQLVSVLPLPLNRLESQGSRGVHVHFCRARSHLVYAYWRFDDAHVRLALPPITARSAQRRTTFSGVVRVPFRPVCCV